MTAKGRGTFGDRKIGDSVTVKEKRGVPLMKKMGIFLKIFFVGGGGGKKRGAF